MPLACVIRIKLRAVGSLKQRLLLPTRRHAGPKALDSVPLKGLDHPINEQHFTLPGPAFGRAIHPLVAAAPYREHGRRMCERDITPAKPDQLSQAQSRPCRYFKQRTPTLLRIDLSLGGFPPLRNPSAMGVICIYSTYRTIASVVIVCSL